jgi:hypothetical protein
MGRGQGGHPPQKQLPDEYKLPNDVQYNGLTCAYLYKVGEFPPPRPGASRISLLRGPLCIVRGTTDQDQANMVNLASRYVAELDVPGAITEYEKTHPAIVAQVKAALAWIRANV